MSRKHPIKDEIRIKIFPQNKPRDLMKITYPAHKKELKFEKPTFFNLAGVSRAVNTKIKLRQFRNHVDYGTELTVKHEFKNKFDERACAVYFKSLKIGYIPRKLNEQFVKKTKVNKYYFFASCFNPLFLEITDASLFYFQSSQ